MDIIPQDIIHKTIIDFYSEAEIQTAKEILYKNYADLVHLPIENMRRMDSGKSEQNVSDYFC